MVLNTKTEDISFQVELNGKKVTDYEAWILTSYPNVVNSRDMFLNGKLLDMKKDETLPDVQSQSKSVKSDLVTLPKLSYGFFQVQTDT